VSRATQVWGATAKRPYPFHCHWTCQMMLTLASTWLSQIRMCNRKDFSMRGKLGPEAGVASLHSQVLLLKGILSLNSASDTQTQHMLMCHSSEGKV